MRFTVLFAVQCSVKGKEYLAFNKQVNQLSIREKMSVMQKENLKQEDL